MCWNAAWGSPNVLHIAHSTQSSVFLYVSTAPQSPVLLFLWTYHVFWNKIRVFWSWFLEFFWNFFFWNFFGIFWDEL